MFKFGLEQEFFIYRQDTQALTEIPKGSLLPHDSCGYLAEARGKPSENVQDAVYLLMSEVKRIKDIAAREGLILENIPTATIPKEMRQRIRRKFAKDTTKYENLYGYESHRNKPNEGTAGIHLSVTNENTISIGDKTAKYNTMWDFVKFFKFLDKRFEDEIKAASRRPGFYEIKPDGRIEYRSLPANIRNLTSISDAVQEYFRAL